MRQVPFAWPERGDGEELDAVVLAPETMETVIALMARVLIAVVRGAAPAAEDADER